MSATFETGLVKCRCQLCNQPIEFQPAEAGRAATCPHCGMETELFIPGPLAAPQSRKRPQWWWIVLSWAWIPFLIAAVVWVIWVVGGKILAQPQGLAAAGLMTGAFIYVALWIAAFILAVFWIVFPVLVYFGIRRVEKILIQIERNTRK